MAEVVDRFQQGMDELVERGARQGQAGLLGRQIAHRFGQDTAERLAAHLDRLSGPEGTAEVTDALIECATGEEFIERVRTD